MLYDEKRKPGNAGNQQTAFQIRKHSLLAVTIIRKLLKSHQFGIYVPFWLQEQETPFKLLYNVDIDNFDQYCDR